MGLSINDEVVRQFFLPAEGLCDFIPIIVCFERFSDNCKKNCRAIKLLIFFFSLMLSGALAVMVDRREIKWTIYCILWGWGLAEASRTLRSSCLVIAFYTNTSASCQCKYLLINVQIQVATNHSISLWTVVSLLAACCAPNKAARVLLAASDVEQRSKERQGSLSDADLVANGSHSWEWPPMSLCGFDKDRDLCSFRVYGSGSLWRCLRRPAATSVSMRWEGGGCY